MEFKIISPQEGGFIKEIQWNNEELKKEIAAKLTDYKTLVFTEDTIKDAKTDRANLRKLREAFEKERKRIKKLCLDPYDSFEKQVKELVAMIDEPIQLIDAQIKEVEQAKKERKRKEIEALFETIGFQVFVTLDSIWDEKWLNASISMNNIEEQMKSRMYQIGEEVYTIEKLPEFSFEAMEVYKKTLDLAQAIQEGQRLSDVQKRKEAFAEEQRKKEEESKEKNKEAYGEISQSDEDADVSVQENSLAKEEQILQIDFRVWGTKGQLMSLRNYMLENHLKFGKVE